MNTASPSIAALEQFQWKPQPQAASLVRWLVEDFLSRNDFAADLSRRMLQETGTRFFDWVDHIAVPRSTDLERQLRETGFASRGANYLHEGAIFPAILLTGGPPMCLAIKVEFVADFLAAMNLSPSIDGAPHSTLRMARVAAGRDATLYAIERHGERGFEPRMASADLAVNRAVHLEDFRLRRRDFETDADGFAHAEELIHAAIADLGVDLACDLFFAAEREYWQRRNTAAQVQKARQDRLGLGWANHDHHTYRSSRQNFTPLIAIFELLGFHCRERFYAGQEAGWGAQVLEQSTTGITIFADVDLSPDELLGDFSHDGLAERHELGTVGLWCALHGEAFLQAGMHHLECQFSFDALRDQLNESDIQVMKPFTNFPFLRQAFTEGQRWPVAETRLKRLLDRNQISSAQAEQFRCQGALGSHLENLERNDGFKGFNQTGVSEIIARTDPRRQ